MVCWRLTEMEFHIFHSDYGALVSNWPTVDQTESFIKLLRYLYLAKVRRLPRLDDFEVSTKYVGPAVTWKDVAIQNGAKWQLAIYENLADATIYQDFVSASTLKDAKQTLVFQYITKKLMFDLDVGGPTMTQEKMLGFTVPSATAFGAPLQKLRLVLELPPSQRSLHLDAVDQFLLPG